MFEYNLNPKTNELYVCLPKVLKYDFVFLNAMTQFIKKVMQEEVNCLLITCKNEAEYEKLCKAYIENVLHSFLALGKKVKWTLELKQQIEGTVTRKEGHKFEQISDTLEIIKNRSLVYYDFVHTEDVEKPVREMARILVEKNFTINTEKVQEFLSTTIGEIFSNSFNHSEREEVFLMYDILCGEESYYLCVNIIDYGTTIVTNVKKYFDKKNLPNPNSVECINWAIKMGNTTREKSGGYGLATLISYIENISGELYIFSGDAYLKITDEEHCVENAQGFFGGTSVTFKVKLYDLDRAITYDTEKEKLVSISLESI